jgi:metal-responsive CopG/Arc/MetJ family transcriptional regulator
MTPMTTGSKQERQRAPQVFAESKAVVQLVLPQGWVARINELAIERGVNRSALIREAIAAMYCAGPRAGETTEMTRMTKMTEHNAPRPSEERE